MKIPNSTPRLKHLGLRVTLAFLVSFAAACSEPTTSLPDPAASPPIPIGRGDANIYLARADGSGITRLARGSDPAWSADGSRIAYTLDGMIRVMNADGSNSITLGGGASPAWSPDGTMIAFVSAEGLSVMHADGTQGTTLVGRYFRWHAIGVLSPVYNYVGWDKGMGSPAWSPDGRYIAFSHLGDDDMMPAQIFVVDALDGSSPRVLSRYLEGPIFEESDPSWAASGSGLLIWSSGYGIAYVSGPGATPITIYPSFQVAYGAKPRWSPDGRVIVFNKMKLGIWTMPATGGSARALIPDAFDAAWSPNGTMLAFVSTRL